MSLYWALDGTEVRESSFEEWRHKTFTRLARDERGGIVVSTIFVGLNVDGGFPPCVFETMVFGGPNDGLREVYHSWGEATHGHAEIAKRIYGGRDAHRSAATGSG